MDNTNLETLSNEELLNRYEIIVKFLEFLESEKEKVISEINHE